MTQRSVAHGTFVIERTYPAAPERVFAAWSSRDAKMAWFGGPEGWESYTLDFRVGGVEHGRGKPGDGPVYSYDAQYQEIVPNERIVTTYTMDMDQTRISASVATVELRPEGAGTRLTLTEMGAFLDGHDKSEFREGGTRELMEALAQALAKSA